MPANLANACLTLSRTAFRLVIATALVHGLTPVRSILRAQTSPAAPTRKQIVVVLLEPAGPSLATSSIIRSNGADKDTLLIQDGSRTAQALASGVFALILSSRTDSAPQASKRVLRLSQPIVPSIWSTNGEMRRAATVVARLRTRPSFILPGRGLARSIVLRIPSRPTSDAFRVRATN